MNIYKRAKKIYTDAIEAIQFIRSESVRETKRADRKV